MKEIVLAVMIACVLTALLALFAIDHNKTTTKTRADFVKTLEYDKGDYVKYKLDGRKGVVIVVSVCPCEQPYKVRFNGLKMISPLLGGKVKVSPYSDMWVEPWEIERWEE